VSSSGQVVRTERLLLRPISPDDAEVLADLYADPEVTRFVRALDLEGTRAQIDRFVDEWATRGIGIFAVVDPGTGEFLGRSGVKYWPEFDFTEAGWVLRRDLWGRGYGTEVGRASLDYAFAHTDLDLVAAIIAKGNDASVRVARKLGMAPLRDEVVYETDCTIFAARRPVG
jgi:RimJ/RimL family protein N-acetyltransferase